MLGHAVIHQKAVGCTEAKSDVDAHVFCAPKAFSCANPPFRVIRLEKHITLQIWDYLCIIKNKETSLKIEIDD